jgi:hypothetical protein
MSLTKFDGRRVDIGFGKEIARGTVVAAAYFEKQAALSIDEKITHVKDESSFGSIEDASQGFLTGIFCDWSLTARVKANTTGLWFLSLFGTDTPTSEGGGNAAVYDHVFTVNETNQSQSLTISYLDPIAGYRFANAMISEADLMMEIGKYFDISLKGQAFAGASNVPTPSFTDETIFMPQMATFKSAANVAGLGAATGINIKKFSLKIAKNLMLDWSFGSTTPTDILNQQVTVTGEVELLFQNLTEFKTNFLTDVAQALQLKVVNTNVTIGATAHPTVNIILDNCKFTDLGRTITNGKIVTQKVKFNAYFSLTNGEMMQVVLSNLIATY